MPWGDGTGPWGLGPMTGRAAGYCAGFPVPGFMNPFPRFGWGRRFGRGFRWRWFWNRPYTLPAQPIPTYPSPLAQPQLTKEQEIQFLEEEIKALEEDKKMLEQELGSIRKRLEELRK